MRRVYLTAEGACKCIDPNPQDFINLPVDLDEKYCGHDGVLAFYCYGQLFAGFVSKSYYKETPDSEEKAKRANENYLIRRNNFKP